MADHDAADHDHVVVRRCATDLSFSRKDRTKEASGLGGNPGRTAPNFPLIVRHTQHAQHPLREEYSPRALFGALRQKPELNPYLRQTQLRTPLHPEP